MKKKEVAFLKQYIEGWWMFVCNNMQFNYFITLRITFPGTKFISLDLWVKSIKNLPLTLNWLFPQEENAYLELKIIGSWGRGESLRFYSLEVAMWSGNIQNCILLALYFAWEKKTNLPQLP